MVGVRTTLISLVLGSILISAGALHAAWWTTATRNSADLANTLERQVTDAVEREWWTRVMSAETSFDLAARLLSKEPRDPAAIAIVAQASGVVSSLVHVDAEGRVSIATERGLSAAVASSTSLDSWNSQEKPHWISIEADPLEKQPAVAYVGAIADGGRLGALIQLNRFASLLGSIGVARTGAAFVIDADGRVVITPDRADKPIDAALIRAAEEAGAIVARRPASAKNIVETVRLEQQGEGYAASLSPLHFQGWQFLVLIPESEFLADIDRATRQIAIGLAILVLAGCAIAVMIAHGALTEPIRAVVRDLSLVAHFDLDAVPYRRSRVREIDQLSSAITRMAGGLADFAKFIPTDLVRSLVANGARAEPDGRARDISILFADVAGFTGMSERLGEKVVPIVSRYLDVASSAVADERGVVDKYIGDAVMALWGAPSIDANHALNACRGALAILDNVRNAGIVDDKGDPLKIRIGIHTGEAIVGNIGSPSRLNYTALGDSVNLASRLEGANKTYGTAILISAATRHAAGAQIVAREIDRIDIRGRQQNVVIYELLGLSEQMAAPAWVETYERALAYFREGRTDEAAVLLANCLTLQPHDGPSLQLLARCRRTVVRAGGL